MWTWWSDLELQHFNQEVHPCPQVCYTMPLTSVATTMSARCLAREKSRLPFVKNRTRCDVQSANQIS